MSGKRALALASDGLPQQMQAGDWEVADFFEATAAIGSAPAAGAVRAGVRTLASREFPAARSSKWPEEVLQGHLARTAMIRWRGQINISTMFLDSTGTPTQQGTATSRVLASTNRATRTPRAGAVSSATAGSLAGLYGPSSSLIATIGDGAGLGGFLHVFRFIPSDPATVSGARMFAGMTSSTSAPTNVEPSSLTNCIGVAQLSTSTNLQIVFGGSSAQTPVDLGASFPGSGASTDIYELIVHAPPGEQNAYWQVTRLNTGDTASGTLTNTTPGTTLPASSTFLSPRIWRTNNATALAVGIDTALMTLELTPQ